MLHEFYHSYISSSLFLGNNGLYASI